MRTYRALDDVPAGARRTVAIGTFDGVHRGHRAIIGAAVAHARAHGHESLVLTFDPHPAEIVRPDRAPPRLTSMASQAELIAALGVDALLVLPFTEALAHTEAAAFVDTVLAARLGVAHVVVGDNFRFGHRAAGDTALLAARGAALGFTVDPHALVSYDGEPVSSSRIRALIGDGDMDGAVRLLAGPLRVDGTVEGGDRRGRTLGIPTANLAPPPGRVVPALGVYVADAVVAGEVVRAAVNVGRSPTFHRDPAAPVRIEAFLLDWSGDLYGGRLVLDFWRFLRGEVAYVDADALMAQVDRDIAATRAFVPPALD